jgi:hypothetical protein
VLKRSTQLQEIGLVVERDKEEKKMILSQKFPAPMFLGIK